MKIPLFFFFFLTEYPLFPERLTPEYPFQYTFSTFLFLSSDDSFGEFLYKNIKKKLDLMNESQGVLENYKINKQIKLTK